MEFCYSIEPVREEYKTYNEWFKEKSRIATMLILKR